MTDYMIISSYRLRTQVEDLVAEIRTRGYTCYSFCDEPADPDNPEADPEVQMAAFESTRDFLNDEHFKRLFARDLEGLRGANKVILLQPAGLSAHMEAGIAFGLGKTLIMVGQPRKPETLYLMFNLRFPSADALIASLRPSVHSD